MAPARVDTVESAARLTLCKVLADNPLHSREKHECASGSCDVECQCCDDMTRRGRAVISTLLARKSRGRTSSGFVYVHLVVRTTVRDAPNRTLRVRTPESAHHVPIRWREAGVVPPDGSRHSSHSRCRRTASRASWLFRPLRRCSIVYNPEPRTIQCASINSSPMPVESSPQSAPRGRYRARPAPTPMSV